MSARRLRRRGAPAPQLLLAPLIDIVFLLLIFFMLVTKFLTPSINVDLPRSVSAEITEEKAIHLTIDSEYELYLGEERIAWDSLVPALKALSEKEKPEIVRIKADKDVPIRIVVRAIDAVRAAGLKTVALETEAPKKEPVDGGES